MKKYIKRLRTGWNNLLQRSSAIDWLCRLLMLGLVISLIGYVAWLHNQLASYRF